MKKIMSAVLAIIMFVTVPCGAQSGFKNEIERTAQMLCADAPELNVGSIGGEWAALGLARSGAAVPEGYFEKYYNNAEKYVSRCAGVLHDVKYTEYSRLILALTAIGKDPENVAGYNLLTPLGDYEKTCVQGINGPVWALIALDSGGYDVPQNEDAVICASREMYLKKILSAQNADGGWGLAEGDTSDIDITAMALCALHNYMNDEEVSAAAERGLDFLSAQQNDEGGFSSWGSVNSESAAQVVVAMCTLGIPQNDSRFVKNGRSPADNMMMFYDGNGRFRHIIDGEPNRMATEQAFYAMAALERFARGENSLYDMSDAKKLITKTEETIGLPGKNADVKVREVIEKRTFSDIAACDGKDKIEALASRGIISGRGGDIYDPYACMTRAEFTVIAVNSLGLPPGGENKFDDISDDDIFAEYIAAAYKYGIVSGISETEFNPNGLITREQAAVMTGNAATLCGMENNFDDVAVRDILSEYTDYVTVSKWAKKAVAFCFESGIYSGEETEIEPQKSVTREEMAEMFYNLLSSAKLII